MSISYIKDTESKEDFLKKKIRKTGSEDTIKQYKQMIHRFEIFCKNELKRDIEVVIEDLIQDWNKSKDVQNLVNLLSNFHDFTTEDHPEITWTTEYVIHGKKANRTYSWQKMKRGPQQNMLSAIRMYLRARTGIRISSEDMTEKITLPVEDTEREEYPLTLDQFQKIYDKCTVYRRKMKYLFMKEIGCRTHESVQTTKKMITFDFDNSGIALVKIPKKIVKGKTKGRINFLTAETAKLIKELCSDLDENTPIFVNPNDLGKSLSDIKQIEGNAFWRERENLVKMGFTEFAEKHESGHHKIVLHSIRAFTATAISKGNGNSDDLGHGYIGHKKYLDQYIRRTEAEQLEIFKNAIPFLTGITKEYGESELAQKVKTQENQLNLQHRQIEELKKTGQKAVKAGAEQSSKWKFVVDELLKLGIVEQTDIVDILSRAPKVPIQKE